MRNPHRQIGIVVYFATTKIEFEMGASPHAVQALFAQAATCGRIRGPYRPFSSDSSMMDKL
jgi:hypothetical protein